MSLLDFLPDPREASGDPTLDLLGESAIFIYLARKDTGKSEKEIQNAYEILI